MRRLWLSLLLVPVMVDAGGRDLSMFTTLTTFGTPQDITLAELAVDAQHEPLFSLPEVTR